MAHVKCYDGHANWLYFLTENDGSLEKFNTIWDKVSSDIEE